MAASGLTCRRCHRNSLVSVWILSAFIFYSCIADDSGNNKDSSHPLNLPPTVLIAIPVRNKAHILPWFLGSLENLNYPKDRIALWIRSDHNVDNTTAMVKDWVRAVRLDYHSVDIDIDEENKGYSDSIGPCDWSTQRFQRVIGLRQQALEAARRIWADYLFILDADVIFTNKKVLSMLIKENKPVIAPMMGISTDGLYSNFWGAMTAEGYYERSEDYPLLVQHQKLGCFHVENVHTAVLIDMNSLGVQRLAYSPAPPNYRGPLDDVIIFAKSASYAGVSLNILNREKFGYIIVPMESHHTLDDEAAQFVHVKHEALVESDQPLPVSSHVTVDKITEDTAGFDQVYLINLVRRPERRARMLESLKALGINVKIIDAIDGKLLNETYLEEKGIKMLEGYKDPYSGRGLTRGEIGCFMSHYLIWKDVIDNKYNRVLLFEDDVRFEVYFRKKLEYLVKDADSHRPDWDLIYLGRKILTHESEVAVEDSNYLIYPGYTYWTISYLLSYTGAQKLMNQDPLSKMVPVDEYLPIMFNRHPVKLWSSAFNPHNLIALSASPRLLHPTHYTGEKDYISDTEESEAMINATEVTTEEMSESEDEEILGPQGPEKIGKAYFSETEEFESDDEGDENMDEDANNDETKEEILDSEDAGVKIDMMHDYENMNTMGEQAARDEL